METVTPKFKLVFVTGPSGAGRTTALNVFEDLGFETIDNMPLEMIPHLLTFPDIDRSLALGIDVRNRNFSVQKTLDILDNVSESAIYLPSLFFLDASEDVLLRRFSETRRKHPLGVEQSVSASIIEESALLKRLRLRSDVMIDTSDLSPHDLKAEMKKWYGIDGIGHLTVSLMSFSYKRGLPKGADMIMDCRFLRNPHWDESLREKTGIDKRVAAFIEDDPKFTPFYLKLHDLFLYLLPAYLEEGKAHFGLALGCTGGKHRSVFIAKKLAGDLKSQNWRVKITHRELD